MLKKHCVILGIVLALAQFGSNLFAANVTVLASDPTASIGTTDPGVFTFTRDGSTTASLTVNFSLGGTAVKWSDYRRLPQGDMPVSFTIPAGASSATMPIYAFDNVTQANPETVLLTVSPDAAYVVGAPSSALVTILPVSGGSTNSSGNTNTVPVNTNSAPANTNIGGGTLNDMSLAMPKIGDNGLRILSPTLLEVRGINSKGPDPATVTNWNLVNSSGALIAPALSVFSVTVNGQAATVQSLGFKRRPIYAPLVNYDLRIENSIYLQLSSALPNNAAVTVNNPGAALWPTTMKFTATNDALRLSPIIHVNEEGYVPSFPKKAMVGYYLGNLGEMDISASLGFTLVDATTGAQVYQGSLALRQDYGYVYSPTPYQKVLEADFSSFTTPGRYRVVVAGLGASLPFSIDDGVAMAFARAYELGLYHQRCGTSNSLPYTRFTHDACHMAPASVPTPQSSFGFTWTTISNYP